MAKVVVPPLETVTSDPEAPVPSREGFQPARGLVFMCDASAEAERLMVALRTRGYPTVDVPLGLLPSRMRYETPDLVVLDADAHEAEKRATQITSNPAITLVLVGHHDGVLDRKPELLALARVVLFRPLNVESAAEEIAGHLGPVARSPRHPQPRTSRAPILVASARKPFRSDSGSSSRPPPPRSDFETEWPTLEQGNRGPMPAESLFPSPPKSSSGPISSRGERNQGLSAETKSLLEQARRKVASQAVQPSRPTRLGPLDGREGTVPAEFLEALRQPLENASELPAKSSPTNTTAGRLSEQPKSQFPGASSPYASLPAEAERSYVDEGELTNPGGRIPSEDRDPHEDVPPLFEDLSDLLEKPTAPPPFSRNPSRDDDPLLDSRPPPFSHKTRETEPPGSLVFTPLPPRAETRESEKPPAAPARDGRPNEVRSSDARGSEGESDSPITVLGEFVGERKTGSLAQAASSGVRRILVKDGDLVTITSSAETESLVQFLETRGDLTADATAGLGALPKFGRHAGAALVARGFLRQDDLWPCLRAHAEWLLGKILLATEELQPEADIPGRLLEEPNVFGGSAGAEIFVDAVRRVVTPEVAYERLGSGARTLSSGSRESLLAECGLSAQLERDVRGAIGENVSRYSERSPHLLPLFCALTELGILSVGGGTRKPIVPSRSVEEQSQTIDLEAFRAKIEARRAIALDSDYFTVLGVSDAATKHEIDRALERIKREFDPSRVPLLAGDLKGDLALIHEVANEAHFVLSDDVRRYRYRRALLAMSEKSREASR